MSVHLEKAFEDEICQHLSSNGWIYEHPVAQDYDREKAIYTPDLIAWVQEAWPDAWESLQTKFGSRAKDQLLSAVRRELDQKGTLEVIRGGVAVFGLRSDLKLAEFKPARGFEAPGQYAPHAGRCRGYAIASCIAANDSAWRTAMSIDCKARTPVVPLAKSV